MQIQSSIPIGRGVVFLWDAPEYYVCTLYPDKLASTGTREPTVENIQEANDEGYGDDVFLALVHHELLHTLVSRLMWQCESRTLRHEAGGDRCPYVERLYEESLVLSVQQWIRTGIDPIDYWYEFEKTRLSRELKALEALM